MSLSRRVRRARRQCGECTACCTILGIEELGKPSRQPCPHECDHGCFIYGQRPASCRAFKCLWLSDDDCRKQLLHNAERPDRCGIMAAVAGPELIYVWEIRPGSIAKNQHVIARLAKRANVIVRSGSPHD